MKGLSDLYCYTIFSQLDAFEEEGFKFITNEKGPADCGTVISCSYGDESSLIAECISEEGCNLIQWCPANGEGLEEPSCHHRHGGKSRACLYKHCKECTKESCDFNRSPDSINNKQKIGHWYTYFKGMSNIDDSIKYLNYNLRSNFSNSKPHHNFFFL